LAVDVKRGSRLRALFIGTLVLAGSVGCSVPATTHEEDDGHPLSVQYGSGNTLSIDPPEELEAGKEWQGTFGAFLPCVAHGEGPIEVTAVHWSSKSGLDPVEVVPYVRTFDSGKYDPWMSMLGSPEEPGEHSDGYGYLGLERGVESIIVDDPCGDVPGSGEGVANEVQIAVTAGSSGAHIGDVTFLYTASDGHEYVLVLYSDFYLCGSEVPKDLCH
jgi:hypothetical protein